MSRKTLRLTLLFGKYLKILLVRVKCMHLADKSNAMLHKRPVDDERSIVPLSLSTSRVEVSLSEEWRCLYHFKRLLYRDSWLAVHESTLTKKM